MLFVALAACGGDDSSGSEGASGTGTESGSSATGTASETGAITCEDPSTITASGAFEGMREGPAPAASWSTDDGVGSFVLSAQYTPGFLTSISFTFDGMPDVRSLRIPLKYLANLLTAGDEAPIAAALERMLAMRAYMRAKSVEGRIDESIPQRVGLTRARIEEMYKIMALAAYEDRYVIPTARRELDENAYVLRGASGFGFSEPTQGSNKVNLFGGAKRTPRQPHMDIPT